MAKREITEEEWENYTSNKIAVKSFKLISAIVLPMIAILGVVFTFFGYREFEFAKNVMGQYTEKTRLQNDSVSDKLKQMETTFVQRNDNLEKLYTIESDKQLILDSKLSDLNNKEVAMNKLRSDYNVMYQQYVNSILSTFVEGSHALVSNAGTVEKLKDNYREIDSTFNEKVKMLSTEEKEIKDLKQKNEKVLNDINEKIDSIKSHQIFALEQRKTAYSDICKCSIWLDDISHDKYVRLKIINFINEVYYEGTLGLNTVKSFNDNSKEKNKYEVAIKHIKHKGDNDFAVVEIKENNR